MALPQPFTNDGTYARTSPTFTWLAANRNKALKMKWTKQPPMVMNHNFSSWREVFENLNREGIRATEIGLELQAGYTLPVKSPALRAALDALVFTSEANRFGGSKRKGNAEWARLLWDADALIARQPQPAQAQGDALRNLLADGFVQIDSFGLNVTALREQAYGSLQKGGRRSRDGELITSRGHLPALEPLLQNESFARIVRGYLGGSARFDGYATFQLTPEANVDSYPSGWWHHDRCGKRLRLFVYVHDVDTDGRPTLAARGSHRTAAYYSYIESILLTRFSEQYVASRYEIVPLTGRAGGGFLLDTNALHRAKLDGTAQRIAILVEFHAHRKIPPLASHPAVMTFPCPSIKGGPHSFTAGVPGYPLYPPDNAPPYQRAFRSVVLGQRYRKLPATKSKRLLPRGKGLGNKSKRLLPRGKALAALGSRGGGAAARGSAMAIGDGEEGRGEKKKAIGGTQEGAGYRAQVGSGTQEGAGYRVQGGRDAQEGRRGAPSAETHMEGTGYRLQRAETHMRDARACFARPRHTGCAAVYAVAPAPTESGSR